MRYADRWLTALLLLFCSVYLMAGWISDYNKGKKYYKKGDYSQALKYLMKAYEDKPDDCADCIREGMHFYDYIPNYYIAECYFQKGETAQAKTFFQRSLKMGVVNRKPGFISAAKDRLAELQGGDAQQPPVEQPSVQPAAPPAEIAPSKPSGPSPQLKEKIQTRLRTVSVKVAEHLRQAQKYPNLRKILNETRRKLNRLQGELDSATDDMQVLSVDRDLSDMVMRLQELAKRIEEARKPKTPPIERPGKPVGQDRPPVKSKPDLTILRQGFSSYFKGDLEMAASRQRRAEAAGLTSCYLPLLKGCILTTLYYLEGGSDDLLLSDAKQAFRAAKSRGCGRSVLTSDHFSPRIVEIFKDAN